MYCQIITSILLIAITSHSFSYDDNFQETLPFQLSFWWEAHLLVNQGLLLALFSRIILYELPEIKPGCFYKLSCEASILPTVLSL